MRKFISGVNDRQCGRTTVLNLLCVSLCITIAISATATSSAQAQPSNAQRLAPNAQFKLIPAGHFVQGRHTGRVSISKVFGKDHLRMNFEMDVPAHPAFITKPFYLATREVTVGQFRQFVEATGYATAAEKSGDGIVGWHGVADQPPRFGRRVKRDPKFTWRSPGFEQTDDHPVVGVSWDDTQAYCRWRSEQDGVAYRLPTEAEWEYACRAGSDVFFSFGNEYRGVMHQYANYADAALENEFEWSSRKLWFADDSSDSAVFTAPVGSYEANAWGLHDMHGNVYEWCQDMFVEKYYVRYRKSPTEPRVGRAFDPVNNDEPWNDVSDWRTIRGGSWINEPMRCRSCNRTFFDRQDGACYLGFRLAHDAPEAVQRKARAAHEAQEAARAAITALPDIDWHEGGFEDLSLRLDVRRPCAELIDLLPKVPRISQMRIDARRGEVSTQLLEAVSRMPDLRELKLEAFDKKLPSDAYSALAGLEQLQVLEFVSNSSVTPAQLREFVSLPNLRTLAIHNNDVTTEQILEFSDLKFPNLTTLNLSRTQCDGTALRVFAESPLADILLGVLTDAGAEQLTRFPELKKLRIDQPRVTGEGIRHLAQLRNIEALRLINMPDVTDADFVPLGQMSGLRELELGGTGAGDLTAEAISGLSLRFLRMDSPSLTDQGIKHLGRITTLNRELSLGERCVITDAGLMHLWGPDHMPQLYLRTRKGITGRGFRTLSHELTGLRHVIIASEDLTDEGLKYLGYLPNLNTVEIGAYRGEFPKQVSDQGLMALAEAPNLSRLRICRDESRRITPEGIAKLKERIPHLRVEEF